jgi:hypothetical protein
MLKKDQKKVKDEMANKVLSARNLKKLTHKVLENCNMMRPKHPITSKNYVSSKFAHKTEKSNIEEWQRAV